MKKLIICSILFISAFSCKEKNTISQTADTSQNTIYKVNPVEIEKAKILFDEGLTFIDIRTPKEIESGKVPNALEIDFRQSNFKDKINELDKDGRYVYYCRSGGRSGKARKVFESLGFKDVSDMHEGYNGWKNYK